LLVGGRCSDTVLSYIVGCRIGRGMLSLIEPCIHSDIPSVKRGPTSEFLAVGIPAPGVTVNRHLLDEESSPCVMSATEEIEAETAADSMPDVRGMNDSNLLTSLGRTLAGEQSCCDSSTGFLLNGND
jgi:hypothetical protein